MRSNKSIFGFYKILTQLKLFFLYKKKMATDGKTTGVLDAERRRASFDATALEEIVNRGRAKAIAKVRYRVKAVFNYFLQ